MYLCTKHERECIACGHDVTPAQDRCPNCHLTLNWHVGTPSNCIHCANNAPSIPNEPHELDTRGILNERVYATLMCELERYMPRQLANLRSTILKDDAGTYADVKTKCPSAVEVDVSGEPLLRALIDWATCTKVDEHVFFAVAYLVSQLIRARFPNCILSLSQSGLRLYRISAHDEAQLSKTKPGGDVLDGLFATKH